MIKCCHMRRSRQHYFRRTTLVFVASSGFVLGIGAAYHGITIPALAMVVSATIFLLTIRRGNYLTIICIGLVTFGAGIYRGQVYVHKKQVLLSHLGQHTSLTVTALSDSVYDTKSQLGFDANQAVAGNAPLSGKFHIGGFGLTSVQEGDRVLVQGKMYPGRGGYQARVSYAKLQLVAHNPSSIADLRRRFTAGIQTALPEPTASFAMGLLIGQRVSLPASEKQALLIVGLTHIIAVSGYNLTIILSACTKLLQPYSRRIASGIAVGLIAIFLLLAGASASIVRAAIVSMLSILAQFYGRSFKPLNLIVIAAAITAWANPYYVWSDISWYLSFLAFYGVLEVAPRLISLSGLRKPSLLLIVAAESLCAELMTLPLVLHVFGQISLVGLLANVVVVPLIPLAMLVSLIAGLAGMWAGSIVGWLALPADLVLTYILDIAHLLSSIPHIFLQNLGFSTPQMLALYGIVLSGIGLVSRHNKRKYGKITDEKAANRKAAPFSASV